MVLLMKKTRRKKTNSIFGKGPVCKDEFFLQIMIVFLDNYFEKQTNVTNVIDIVIQVTTKLKRKRKSKKEIQIRITLLPSSKWKSSENNVDL